jgi:hypothetical protein
MEEIVSLKNKIFELSQELLSVEENTKWNNLEIMEMKSQMEEINIIINDCHKQLAKRDKIIAEGTEIFEDLKKSLEEDEKKFMVGENRVIWDHIIIIMDNLRVHFDVIQHIEALSQWI